MNKSHATTAMILLSFGVAAPATAVSSLSLLWRTTGTATTTVTAASTAKLIADVVLQADLQGVSSLFVSFEFDFDGVNELDIEFAPFEGEGVAAANGSFFSAVSPGTNVTESAIGLTGQILNWDSLTIATGAIGETLTLGTIVFRATGNQQTDGVDVIGALINPGVDSVVSAYNPTPEDISSTFVFNGASLNLPEPTIAVLIVFGLVLLLGTSRVR